LKSGDLGIALRGEFSERRRCLTAAAAAEWRYGQSYFDTIVCAARG